MEESRKNQKEEYDELNKIELSEVKYEDIIQKTNDVRRYIMEIDRLNGKFDYVQSGVDEMIPKCQRNRYDS